MKNKLVIILSGLASLLALPSLVFALNDIPTIFNNIINDLLWPVFLSLVIIMFIWAGWLFLSARGEPGKVDTARKAVFWGIIGIVVALMAASVVGILKELLGV